MDLNKIPTTVITGFLGSGKTTLLHHILSNAGGRRIAVIMNEFGERDIDSELLGECPLPCDEENEGDKGIYELANGCICCTVAEEFLPVMQELVKRRDSIDHIIIETSGLALPKPLVQAFNWPDVKPHCTVDGVIALVDGPAIAAGRYAHNPEQVRQQRLADDNLDHDPTLRELLEDQLSAADLVLVSKADCLDQTERERVNDWLRSALPPAVKTLFTSKTDTEIDTLLGCHATSEKRIEDLVTHHDHHHEHGKDHHHTHDDFDSVLVEMGAVDPQRLQHGLNDVISSHTIYRVKGFAALPDKPMRQVIQAVGQRIDAYFDRLWQPEETPATQLVLIGKDLDAHRLREQLSRASA